MRLVLKRVLTNNAEKETIGVMRKNPLMKVVPAELRPNDSDNAQELYEHLERGNVLLLQQTPFIPSGSDADFLRAQNQSTSSTHKNIAYKPALKSLTGVQAEGEAAARMKRIMTAYSEGSLAFLSALLPAYARHWKVDYASYRPLEEQGRDLPLRHRNDLLHVDSFPTRPTHGGRILRSFTNLHPTRERVWATGASFEEIAAHYAVAAGLKQIIGPTAELRRTFARAAGPVGMPIPVRSPYDEIMLRLHHYLKGDAEFQKTWQCNTTSFESGESWICFTDQVAHAVVSGQYAMEQTCIVPYAAMVLPELAPVKVLERLAGRSLVRERATAA